MNRLEENPHYLNQPIKSLIISWAAYTVVVLAIFVSVEALQPSAEATKPYLTALPGLSLGGYLLLLLRYFAQYDEMLKSLLLKSLSASALTGFSVQLGSLVRTKIAALEPFHDAFVISIMAIAFVITAVTLLWKYR